MQVDGRLVGAIEYDTRLLADQDSVRRAGELLEIAIDRERFHVVGQEINANHIRPLTSGWVVGTAKPVNIGRRAHVWEIRIEDERGKLVCVSRLTLAVIQLGDNKPA